MVQSTAQTVTFDAFVEWYPETGRYELINGTIVEMFPTGPHENVVGFLAVEVGYEIRRSSLLYSMPKTYLVRSPDRESGYQPDLLVVDPQALDAEPLWPKQSIITMGSSIKLAVEVVSTNWKNDYLRKLADYEDLGISEYWIVDYRALGAVRYIGLPKVPIVSVYALNQTGEYELRQFKGTEKIESLLLPELALTVDRIVIAAGADL
ncbi:Uma2 family endonuclease [Altericista sp. CCNU0014]|uniref:Uma2 family endonuclease n=1 Tax=Altericista sp. CCNU0014 TaxID=3082949 RepID=UPI00384D6867